ncbi:GNAT family N-acetyltransferase [Pseudomonas panipatensis]|uniref:GNAT family N-acetyltransferase n=1 Tax=Pseudomonas panipatensis TaxID=428992 RepID=UPI0035B29889
MTESTNGRALIRQASAADARALAEVHVLSWQAAYRGLLADSYLAGLASDLERRVAFLDQAIRSGGRDIRVAELDGAVVGWSSFGRSRDEDALAGTGELYSLYLAPQAWSRGIGRDLWQCSRQHLHAAGFLRVTLWALDGNQRALRFYRAAGFRPERQGSRVFEEGGTAFPVTRYQLRLA